MIESFLITGRETLEASLVVGIVLAYLAKTNHQNYRKSVYLGIAAGILGSILAAFLFHRIAGGFEGTTEAIFEGTTMLIGAALLTTMIFWMSQQRHIGEEIRKLVDKNLHIENPMLSQLGIFALIFIAIIREGVETVIFLNAINFANGVSFVSASLGILVAIGIGYACFVSFRKIDLKNVFRISSVLLILFAAGLVAHGVHEFEEAGVIPYPGALFDINPELGADGSFPALHEKGVVGSFLVGLFGYNGNPSLLEILAYLLYLVPALWFFVRPQVVAPRISR